MSSATNAFEDLGYFCVDNLPLTLLPTFARLVRPEDRHAHAHRARRPRHRHPRGPLPPRVPRAARESCARRARASTSSSSKPRTTRSCAASARRAGPHPADDGRRPRRSHPRRARRDGGRARARRPGHRHFGAHRPHAAPPPARTLQPRRGRRGDARAGHQLRLQARLPARHRFAVRRAPPAEPALRPGAARLLRPRPARRQVPDRAATRSKRRSAASPNSPTTCCRSTSARASPT